jgi:hypothetical protein
MARFTGSGGVRPSRAASLVAAVVGLGMLLAVASFVIGGPLVGIGMFFLTWAFAVAAIVCYHLWNAFSPDGVDHTQFHVRGEHDSAQPGEPKARP